MKTTSKNTILKSLSVFFSHENEPDLEEQARKRLCTIFLFLIGIPLLFVGVNHLFTGLIAYGATNIATALIMIGFIPALRFVKRGIVIFRVLSMMVLLLLFYWIFTVAINGYASIWAVIYPIFFFFLLGKKEGLLWSASVVIVCVVFFFNPLNLPNVYQYPGDFASRLIGALLFVIFLTYFYESVRAKYRDAFDRERSELQHHRDNLETLVARRTDEIRRKNIELKNTLGQLQETTAQYLKSQIEKEKIQEQLAHSQKMEAVGTLAGGLAHDFNNLLGGIIGSFDILDILLKDERLENKEEIREFIDLGIQSSKKSSNIIKHLLALSHRHEITLTPVNMNDPLRNVLSICRNSLSKSINLNFIFSDEPIMVMAEPGYIEQVLLNLCINAAHSMTTMRGDGETPGGTLTVQADTVVPDKSRAGEEPEAPGPNPWARIRVIDTGVGIPDEYRTRIFEPFFTTKKNEGGSGLGLAMSYGIMKQHDGFISVKSSPGGGSIFSVFIPLIGERTGASPDKTVTPKTRKLSGSGTILVIDDETCILDVARGLLKSFGWTAFTAGTPEEGISIFRERSGEISAVMLDLSMPGKSGIDVYRELSAIDPGVKVVLCSGMVDNEVRSNALAAGIHTILNKPYDGETLFKTLNDLIYSSN